MHTYIISTPSTINHKSERCWWFTVLVRCWVILYEYPVIPFLDKSVPMSLEKVLLKLSVPYLGLVPWNLCAVIIQICVKLSIKFEEKYCEMRRKLPGNTREVLTQLTYSKLLGNGNNCVMDVHLCATTRDSFKNFLIISWSISRVLITSSKSLCMITVQEIPRYYFVMHVAFPNHVSSTACLRKHFCAKWLQRNFLGNLMPIWKQLYCN